MESFFETTGPDTVRVVLGGCKYTRSYLPEYFTEDRFSKVISLLESNEPFKGKTVDEMVISFVRMPFDDMLSTIYDSLYKNKTIKHIVLDFVYKKLRLDELYRAIRANGVVTTLTARFDYDVWGKERGGMLLPKLFSLCNISELRVEEMPIVVSREWNSLAVKTAQSVRVLRLSSVWDVKVLSTLLRFNTSIQEMYIGGMSEDDIEELEQALLFNDVLRVVEVKQFGRRPIRLR